jgi:DNA mismatch repair ATPase MutS
VLRRDSIARSTNSPTKLRFHRCFQESPPTQTILVRHRLLQGTNSRDRLIGAEGILRELVRVGSIGILTTHDLSLTMIDNMNGSFKNLHFQDSIVNGKMQFDFRLRDGVVTKSNGVELMRLIGLKV